MKTMSKQMMMEEEENVITSSNSTATTTSSSSNNISSIGIGNLGRCCQSSIRWWNVFVTGLFLVQSIILVSQFYNTQYVDTTTTNNRDGDSDVKASTRRNSNSNNSYGKDGVPPRFFFNDGRSLDVIYGHVHVAKTAGSTINGELASHFERVCGHKGYSQSYFGVNQRTNNKHVQDDEQEIQMQMSATTKTKIPSNYKDWMDVPYSKVKVDEMELIGFEDCDYISEERSATVWKTHAKTVGPIELHVPCRNDPIDHLLSTCNHLQKQLNCTLAIMDEESLFAEIEKCLPTKLIDNRYSDDLLTLPNTTIKCFNPIPTHPYIEYMSNRLQRRRMESTYVPRETNRPRDKSKECLMLSLQQQQQQRPPPQDDQEDADADAVTTTTTTVNLLIDRVRDILIREHPYFRFCHRCMNSSDNLLLL